MQRSYGYDRNQPQYVWDTTSQDYHAHLTKMQRMPSVLGEAPRYPILFKVFNNNNTYTSEEEQETPQEQQQQKKSPPKAQKKVQMNERVEIVESSNNDENGGVHEDSIDNQANGFIQGKRRGFELCKWKTFKMQ